MPPTPASGPSANGHGDLPPGLKTPAPHPAPSLAAKMAEADAEREAAAMAELKRQVHATIADLLENDLAGLLMALPDLFGASLAEMIAMGVQRGLQRAAQAELAGQQPQGAPAGAAGRKPLLIAQMPLTPGMIRDIGGTPGAFGGMTGAAQ